MTESSAEAFATLMFIRLTTPMGLPSSLRWMAKESSARGGAQGRRGPASEAPDLWVPVPFAVESVVLGRVASQLDPLPDQLLRSHEREYSGFNGEPLC